MNNYSVFGQNLREYRKKLGLTQGQLAEKVLETTGKEITGAAISTYEKGNNAPNLQVIPALAEVLGVSIDELFGKEPKFVLDVPSEEVEHPLKRKIAQLEEALHVVKAQESSLQQKVDALIHSQEELLDIAKKQQEEILILKSKFHMIKEMFQDVNARNRK